MRLLLDTHAFLWWLADDPQLSPKARQVVEARANTVFVSAASIWEISHKQSKGLLQLPGSAQEAIDACGFTPLPIDCRAAEHASSLPWHHRDPWDRLLITQAVLNDLTLVSKDTCFSPYEVSLLW